jgi:hypothetical protein
MDFYPTPDGPGAAANPSCLLDTSYSETVG